jgi:multisubunit Na+/H+ antiporter MnhC subunit
VLLSAIFLFGLLEAAVFKQKDWACATWAVGIVALAVWIIYPGSEIRILLGLLVLVSGFALMILYYGKSASRS